MAAGRLKPLKRQRIARQDAVKQFAYFLTNADSDVADRFFAQLQSTYAKIQANLGVGSPIAVTRAELAGLRKRHVSGFESVFVFYRELPDHISVIRILYAAQDWWSLVGVA